MMMRIVGICNTAGCTINGREVAEAASEAVGEEASHILDNLVPVLQLENGALEIHPRVKGRIRWRI